MATLQTVDIFLLSDEIICSPANWQIKMIEMVL